MNLGVTAAARVDSEIYEHGLLVPHSWWCGVFFRGFSFGVAALSLGSREAYLR